MTTCLDIANRALRPAGILGAGQEIAGRDQADVLAELQDIIDDLPLFRSGEWTDVTLTSAAAYSASDGERIDAASYAATITLPATYEDEDGTTKTTRDLSRVQVIGADAVVDYGGDADGAAGLYVYSASRGSWAQADGLTLQDESPFGPEDDGGLAALLAVAAAPLFGVSATAVQNDRALRALKSFRARFYREVNVPMDRAFLVMSDTGRNGFTDLAD